jgi:hypothetical protein
MPYSQIIAAYSKTNMKQINTIRGPSLQFLALKRGAHEVINLV